MSGRVVFRLSALDVPVRELTVTDIRASMAAALEDADRGLRDRRYEDAAKYINDARLLLRALRRFELRQELHRLERVAP